MRGLGELAVAGLVGNFGVAAAGVWQAPGRANLIGEHTDYNDGFVLPFAVPRHVTVAAAPADGPQWSVWSDGQGDPVTFTADDLEPGRVTGWAAYVAGVFWALRTAGHPVRPLRLALASDVPLGAGLSSSAAIECAVLTAAVELDSLDVPVADRPRLAQRAENGYVGVPCGIMDQSAATLCRAGHALFLDCRDLAVEHIPFDLAALGHAILVIDTRAPHRHVANEYAARRAACESAAAALGVAALRDIDGGDLPAVLDRLGDPVIGRRVRHVVTENERVLATVAALRGAEPDLGAVGPLLVASHASMRDDYEITVGEVDLAVDTALDAGALGARMTGGGFGGCVLALVTDAKAGAVAGAVADAFTRAGYAAPATFAASPAAGAARIG